MRRVWTSLIALALLIAIAPAARGQIQLASRGPKFLSATLVSGKRTDASGAAVLRRRVAVTLTSATIEAALKEIARQADLELIFTRTVLPRDRTVTLHATDITVAGALTVALLDTGLDVLLMPGGQMGIVPRTEPAAPAQLGSIVGRVTDVGTTAVLIDATVVLEGTPRTATTNSDGRYRFTDVTPGTYTVRVRSIGYKPSSASVTVIADQEATADLALEKSAQRLDEIVTTGTIVPTEVKALPTPVSIITDSEIAALRPVTVQQILRQAVPTAVSWDLPASPENTFLSVRGASTLNPFGGQLKVFVDGIQTASLSQAGLDPRSIARIEVIRGPEASAIYGSDAIGGVMQIFTKRGLEGTRRPVVTGEAALGVVQAPYAGFGGTLRQSYSASVRGGGPDFGYDLGGSYSRTGDWVPEGAMSNPSFYGGMHYSRGPVALDVSGRYYTWNTHGALNPLVFQTGLFSPGHLSSQQQSQALGAQLTVTPKQWWRTTLTGGLNRGATDTYQTSPTFAFPGDSLLLVSEQEGVKSSVGLTSTILGRLGSTSSGSITVGADHYSYPVTGYSASGTANTTGSLGGRLSATRTITNNTGYFAQAQIGYRDALFLTGGIRAEQNTGFGDSISTPLSPRFGLSFVHAVGGATVKLRGSWGKAIRAPSPLIKLALTTPTAIRVANEALAPERQKGWDAGADVTFGSAASLGFTVYDQTAEGLVDAVVLAALPVPTTQFQNLGAVKNTGIEIEGALAAGPISLRAQYGYARARVEQLSPTYSGNLAIGDQVNAVPRHTAGASITVTPASTTSISLGMTYVGSWVEPDYLAYFGCLGATAACRGGSFDLNDYYGPYPSLVKLNLTATRQINASLSGFISIANLTNNESYEFINFDPAQGRVSTFGLRFQY